MKKYSIKEIQKWLRGLEENKWRKRYAVDAKRVCHFANLGESLKNDSFFCFFGGYYHT